MWNRTWYSNLIKCFLSLCSDVTSCDDSYDKRPSSPKSHRSVSLCSSESLSMVNSTKFDFTRYVPAISLF